MAMCAARLGQPAQAIDQLMTANGAFLFGSSSGTRPGVYKVDLGSGTATMWGTGQPKQGAALDAKNVYFIDSASDLVALTR